MDNTFSSDLAKLALTNNTTHELLNQRIEDLEEHTEEEFAEIMEQIGQLVEHTEKEFAGVIQRIEDLEEHTEEEFAEVYERINSLADRHRSEHSALLTNVQDTWKRCGEVELAVEALSKDLDEVKKVQENGYAKISDLHKSLTDLETRFEDYIDEVEPAIRSVEEIDNALVDTDKNIEDLTTEVCDLAETTKHDIRQLKEDLSGHIQTFYMTVEDYDQKFTALDEQFSDHLIKLEEGVKGLVQQVTKNTDTLSSEVTRFIDDVNDLSDSLSRTKFHLSKRVFWCQMVAFMSIGLNIGLMIYLLLNR